MIFCFEDQIIEWIYKWS